MRFTSGTPESVMRKAVKKFDDLKIDKTGPQPTRPTNTGDVRSIPKTPPPPVPQRPISRLPTPSGMKKGGKVASASKRADGIAKSGKTKGRMI